MPKKKATKNKAVKSVLVSPTLAVALAIFSMAFSLMVITAVGQPARTGKIKSGQIKMASVVNVSSGVGVTGLQTAINNASCGDVVSVQPGDYTTTDIAKKLSITQSCTASAPLIIKAVNSAAVGGINSVTNGFKLVGKNYIIIDGFEITTPRDVAWDDCTSGSANGSGIFLRETKGVVVKNNYIHDTLGPAISVINWKTDPMASSDNLISHNTIIRAGGLAGIGVQGSNNTIEYNDISHTIQHPLYPTASKCVGHGADADGIKFGGSTAVSTGLIIRGNHIHDITWADAGNHHQEDALDVGYSNQPHIDCLSQSNGVSNILIEKNFCDLPDAGGSYVQGIYLADGQSNGAIIRNNISYTLKPLYLRNVSGSIIIANNTFIQVKNEVDDYNVQLKSSPNAKIKNNIFYNKYSPNSNYMIIDTASSSGLEIANNCYYLAGVGINGDVSYDTGFTSSFGSNVITATSDSIFTNASAKDFSLTANSPCKDKGADLSALPYGVVDDYAGTARPQPLAGSYDIGAYEYQASGSKSCDCTGKACGDDGCGNSCGSCQTNQTCQSGQCITSCAPTTCAALGKTCGSQLDGCGGTLSCGSCSAGYECSNGACKRVCSASTCSGYYTYWFKKYYYSCTTKGCCTTYPKGTKCKWTF